MNAPFATTPPSRSTYANATPNAILETIPAPHDVASASSK